jgi:hypothetical protein
LLKKRGDGEVQDLDRGRVHLVVAEHDRLVLHFLVAGQGDQPGGDALGAQVAVDGQGGVADRVAEVEGRQELFDCHGSLVAENAGTVNPAPGPGQAPGAAIFAASLKNQGV